MHTPTNSAEDALRGDGSRADAASQAAGSPVRSGAGAGAGAGAVGSAASAGPSTPVVMERPLSSKVPLTPAKERERIRLENSRTEKWRGVMQNWKLCVAPRRAGAVHLKGTGTRTDVNCMYIHAPPGSAPRSRTS